MTNFNCSNTLAVTDQPEDCSIQVETSQVTVTLLSIDSFKINLEKNVPSKTSKSKRNKSKQSIEFNKFIYLYSI